MQSSPELTFIAILAALSFALALLWRWLVWRPKTAVRLRAARALLQGRLQEMLLYGAYPRVLLATLADVGRACLGLSGALLVPSLLFLPPLLLTLYLSAGLYHHRPFKVGESAILTSPDHAHFDLESPPQVEVEIANFSHPRLKVRLFRVRATQPGSWKLGPAELSTTLAVSTTPEQAYPWIDPLDKILVHPTRAHLSRLIRAPWWAALLLLFLLWSWLLTLHPRRGNSPA